MDAENRSPKHLSSKEKRKLPRINRLFSKVVIVYCMLYMTRVTERVLDIAQTTEHGSAAANILTAAGIVFGGELLLLAFKDVMANAANATVDKAKATLNTTKETVKSFVDEFKDC